MIDMLLRENDYFRLRSFHGYSAFGTWLFSVVKHHIGKELRRQNRMVSLDMLPPSSLASESDQEQSAMLEELERIVLSCESELTAGEKRLFSLLREK
jgi:DNA-directed RNA polymerase specialized sigma24 family protein